MVPELEELTNVAVPVNAGAALIAKVLPVPVCEATEVAFPTDVIGPVKLAFVITVAAKLPVPLPVTPPVRVIVWSPVLVPDTLACISIKFSQAVKKLRVTEATVVPVGFGSGFRLRAI